MVSAWLITVADLPAKVVALLEPFMGNQTLLLIAIMLLVMAVGTAMDMTPTILIMTPVLVPVVKAAGIDPIYFGVLFIINNAIGLITPPLRSPEETQRYLLDLSARVMPIVKRAGITED